MTITKATRDVLDLATRTVIAIDVNCSGTNLIDNVQIGSRVPNTGDFTDIVADTVTLNASGTLDLSDTGVTVLGKLRAYYADVAEKYAADKDYPEGTILEFGGEQEVTEAGPNSNKIAGVVSSQPFMVLNESLNAAHSVNIALSGRVPCRVWGPVRAGDFIIVGPYGVGEASVYPVFGQVVGRAIKGCSRKDERMVEVKVGM